MSEQVTVPASARSDRARAILRAVAAGRATASCGCEPDLFVDGLACCDQPGARALRKAGLFAPVRSAGADEVVPVDLTDLGRTVLGLLAPAA